MKRYKFFLAGLIFTFNQFLFAAEIREFDLKIFEEAQNKGATVLLDFHADWCSTCVKQKAIFEKLNKEGKLGDLKVLTVNFDDDSKIKKNLKVIRQSTLILFKGSNEVGRSLGITDEDDILTFLNKTK